jgi:hypothetical protein
MGAFRGVTNFSQSMYDPGMDTERRELWDQLENEPKRAFQAFQTFLRLPSGSRTVVEAYRRHVDNPQATRVSDTWAKWSRDFAWSARAEARDHHLEQIREQAMEEAIKEEAQKMAREAEKTRFRFSELMTYGYESAAEWLENAQPSDFRPSDIIQIIRLHMDAVKAFDATETSREEVTWTDEEQAELTQIIKGIDAEEADEDPDKDPGEDEGSAGSSEGQPRP